MNKKWMLYGLIFIWVSACGSHGGTAREKGSKVEASAQELEASVQAQVTRYKKMLAGGSLPGGKKFPAIPPCKMREHEKCRIYYNEIDDQLREQISEHETHLRSAELSLEKARLKNEDFVPFGEEANYLEAKLSIEKRQLEGVQGLARYHANQGKYVQNESFDETETPLTDGPIEADTPS